MKKEACAARETRSRIPNGSNHAEKAAVLPTEYAGTIGWPVRSASLAMPLRCLSLTTSSFDVHRKMPAMPSGTVPTHVPASRARAIDLPDTSMKP